MRRLLFCFFIVAMSAAALQAQIRISIEHFSDTRAIERIAADSLYTWLQTAGGILRIDKANAVRKFTPLPPDTLPCDAQLWQQTQSPPRLYIDKQIWIWQEAHDAWQPAQRIGDYNLLEGNFALPDIGQIWLLRPDSAFFLRRDGSWRAYPLPVYKPYLSREWLRFAADSDAENTGRAYGISLQPPAVFAYERGTWRLIARRDEHDTSAIRYVHQRDTLFNLANNTYWQGRNWDTLPPPNRQPIAPRCCLRCA